MRFMAMAWELVHVYHSSLRRPVRSLLPNQVDIWSHGLMGAEQLDSINAQDLLLPAELDVPMGT